MTNEDKILIYGTGKLLYSVSACLLKAEHPIYIVTSDVKQTQQAIHTHLVAIEQNGSKFENKPSFKLIHKDDVRRRRFDAKMAILITSEKEELKIQAIEEVEHLIPRQTLIAVNTESIPLNHLQKNASVPQRIIGLNWTEPAHTTLFLELIDNGQIFKEHIKTLKSLAERHWNKDPYIVRGDLGIRSRVFTAMIREAFYLIENGYASIEDIDRACRNDPGYYLPFAGNFRYMDLMGTYAYRMVMKELNPDLSKQKDVPQFFQDLVSRDRKGMENEKGFYDYEEKTTHQWEKLARQFSYDIERIIKEYLIACSQ